LPALSKNISNEKMKLTLEQLKVRAAKYPSRTKLYKHDPSAYLSARNQGLLDTLYPDKGAPPPPLTFEQLLERACKYERRVDFKRADDSGYKSAVRQGFINVLFPKPPRPVSPPRRVIRHLTEACIREIAAGFKYRADFQKADKSAAETARKMGLLPELFPGDPVRTIRKMTNSLAKELCSEYSSRSHLQAVDPSLYAYMRNRNLLAETFPKSLRRASNDAFYMTRMLDQWFNGLPVYKVGVTSGRLGAARIKSQNRNARAEHAVIIQPTLVVGLATDVEQYALSLGENPKFTGFDGCTEYRAYSDQDVRAITDMVELCAATKQDQHQ